MIKTIIVDDDSFHIESMLSLLNENFKQVEVIATSTNVPDAVKKIGELKPLLVFLDIEMSPYTGFDLLEMVEERDFEVIFTTSYQKYAIQAIKASALDYIEKPLNKALLAEALQRFKAKSGKAKVTNLLSNFKLNSESQKIALSDKSGLNFFELKNIIRCQSDNSYTEFIILSEGEKSKEIVKIIVSKGFNDFEDFLVDKGCFYRVHNQHLVNINHIKKYVKDDGGYLIMDDNLNVTIPVARSRREDFLSYLKTKGIII